MTTLPAIYPTGRRQGPGQWPVRVTRTINGASYRRLFGSLPTSLPLEFEFFATTEDVRKCRDAYNASRGGFSPVQLPQTFFAGNNDVQVPDGYKIYFSGEPEERDVFPGHSRLTLRFTAEPQ